MKIPSMLVMAVVLGSPALALADDAHHPMGPMHEHMKLMREQMAQIRAAKDPKEKERLVNAHLKTMEESMTKMPGMMGCGKT